MLTETQSSRRALDSAVATAAFGLVGATAVGIVVAMLTSTAIGGTVGVGLGVAVAVYASAKGQLFAFIGSLEALPGAAITLFLLGAFVPVSVDATLIAGLSLDDVPTLAAVGLGLLWVAGNRSSITLPRIAVPLFALVAWTLVTWALVDPSLRSLFIGTGRWAIYAFMLVLGIIWFKETTMRWWFIGLLIALAFIQALVSIWAYHADWFVTGSFVGIERFRWYQPLSDVVNGRATGFLGIASNFFGGYVLIPAFAALGIALTRRSTAITASMLTVFGLLTYAGVISYTRATVIGLILGVIGLLVVTRPLPMVPVVVAVVAIAIIATPFLSRFEEGNDRLSLTGEAASIISKNPITGVGSGDYLDPVTGEPTEEDGPEVTPHNSFLLQASETGLLGGLLLLAAVLALLAGVWGGPLDRTTVAGLMCTAIFAGMGAVLVQTLSNNLLHIPPVATQFWLAGAAGVAFATSADGSWAHKLSLPTFSREP